MEKYESQVYQHGTLGMLVPGLFEGTLTVAELRCRQFWRDVLRVGYQYFSHLKYLQLNIELHQGAISGSLFCVRI